MAAFIPIVSSNLKEASYDAAAKDLVVHFQNGTGGKYENVPVSKWKEFQSTFDGKDGRSAGTFLHKYLKGVYTWTAFS